MVGFHHFLAWALLLAAPFGQAASISQAATATSERQQAVVENLLSGPSIHAQIVAALQAERADMSEEAPHSLHLSLAKLGLPVPPEIRDLADKANGNSKVTAGEADRATATLNKMLEEQHWLLDHKVIDCREKRRSTGEAIQEAAAEVRNLASATSAARGIIVDATSRIPQDRRSFEEFKAEAEISRSRCESATRSDNVKAKKLEREAVYVAALQEAVRKQCAGSASFLQDEPEDEANEIIADAEKSIKDVDVKEPVGLSQSAVAKEPSDDVDVFDVIAGAERELHSEKAFQKRALEAGGCPAIAAGLGVVAKTRGGPAASAFLQELNPESCKLTAHSCSAMFDVAAEVAGEIADSQARLKASSARGRDACKDEQLFAKNQLSMETSQASDRSRELGEATFKAGQVGDLTNQKDSERRKMQAKLKAITGKCESEIKDILYGKMCALQKVRDGLQILAGRTELPEDCQVTDWDEGICSATCGGGMKTLNRKVSLAPKGGAACPPLQLHLHCGETACPKDCEVSEWSGFSACSARCDGGIQERNRHVTANPVGNGAGCPHLVDMQLCNSEACTSDCEFLQWTSWSPCSKACGGGTKTRARGLRDEGKASCPSSESNDRLEFQECNKERCNHGKDFTCAGAQMDMVLLLDASGSMTQAGFGAVKNLAAELVRHYSPSENGVKLSIAAFAKKANSISGLTSDASELTSRLSSQAWLEGPSNAASGLARAASLMAAGGRKKAMSVVLMVTDGRVVDPFLARQAADRLKKSGIRLVFGLVGTHYRNAALLKSMASLPEKDNVIQLPGLQDLQNGVQGKFSAKQLLEWTAKRMITSTCSATAP